MLYVVATLLCLTPLTVHAQGGPTWEKLSLKGVIDVIIAVVGGFLLPIAITILFLVFVVGIISYIRKANSGGKDMAEAAQKRLLYPVIIMFILFTLWGLVNLIQILFSR